MTKSPKSRRSSRPYVRTFTIHLTRREARIIDSGVNFPPDLIVEECVKRQLHHQPGVSIVFDNTSAKGGAK